MKLTTKHLSYEHGFVSVVQPDGNDVECGCVHPSGWSTCFWPTSPLGEEPAWFGDEIATLAEQVADECMRLRRKNHDYRAQVDEDFLRGKGTR